MQQLAPGVGLMSRRMIGVLVVLAIGIAAAVAYWAGRPLIRTTSLDARDLPSVCRLTNFEDTRYVTCAIDRGTLGIGIFLLDANGKAFGSLDAFDDAMTGGGRVPVLAMNAGMYHRDLTPVGLLVEAGQVRQPLETGDGEGNFYLKPNGVFFIGMDGVASILETVAYEAADPRPREATQSGPMLVVDGQIHPRFEPNGTSRFIRNGVGVRDDGTAVLVISLDKVSLGSFARFFRDGSRCPNALFFDGEVSAMSNGNKVLVGGDHPTGPIIAVFGK